MQREANELPLNGSNIYNLTTITPSVVPQGNTMGTAVGKNPFDFANYQIGGAFANEGAIYLDGQPLNIGYINLPLLVPTAGRGLANSRCSTTTWDRNGASSRVASST